MPRHPPRCPPGQGLSGCLSRHVEGIAAAPAMPEMSTGRPGKLLRGGGRAGQGRQGPKVLKTPTPTRGAPPELTNSPLPRMHAHGSLRALPRPASGGGGREGSPQARSGRGRPGRHWPRGSPSTPPRPGDWHRPPDLDPHLGDGCIKVLYRSVGGCYVWRRAVFSRRAAPLSETQGQGSGAGGSLVSQGGPHWA